MRPDTATNHQASGGPQGRGVHQHPEIDPASHEALERPLGGVRQDKARLENAREASRQPAAVNKFTRAQFTNNDVVRSQNGSGASRKVRVTLWVDPTVKAHVERLAGKEGLSVSAAGAAFLRRALQQDVDLEYSALLRPIIEKAIARQMAGLATRLTWLLVRIAFDAGQTRSLVTNILGRQLDKNQPLLKTILDGSARSAKANIMRRTPQIASLISSVEQWMTEDKEQEKKTA
jgi:hypothetical protein